MQQDDLSDAEPSHFTDAKHFRAFCPTSALPSVAVVSPTGARLGQVEGPTHAQGLRSAIAEAVTSFRQQQAQAAMAAMAALASAGSGGGGPAEAQAGPAAEAAEPLPATQPAAEPSPAEGDGVPDVLLPAVPEAGMRAAAAAGGDGTGSEACELQFRFTNGSRFQAEFSGEYMGSGATSLLFPPPPHAPPPAPRLACPVRPRTPPTLALPAAPGSTLLSEVFAAVDAHRSGGGGASASAAALPYVLVQSAPRLVLGAADEGRALAAAGVLPRSSLAVVPNRQAGHLPPQPSEQEAARPEAEPAAARPAEAGAQEGVPAAEFAAVPAPEPAAPALEQHCEVAVRQLGGAGTLRRRFGPGATLAHVLDWLDEERSDGGWGWGTAWGGKGGGGSYRCWG